MPPRSSCRKEQSAFDKAAADLNNAEFDFRMKTISFEAVIWGSGAASLKKLRSLASLAQLDKISVDKLLSMAEAEMTDKGAAPHS